ncbi:3-deoxy-D-manno-octulosonic acid transferase [Roseobacter sp. HKCCA0434]|uniref:3-deoxy-D-manno-octulosonic acid transferase n=1 Tax=Roseobacter sp. HKCCA0434 TaxID=3079297 RepID=UPI002905CB72|nr:3-deoxy-D-manno-octulosonic acid transferase [Roseobacter sp. HKCCA0434]
MPALSSGLYGLFSRFGGGYGQRLLARRVAEGKEDPARLDERLGHASVERPEGPLIWFHAASVGESLSLLDLLSRIRAGWPEIAILVTTGTVTSADLMRQRLPEGVLHQYYPLDFRAAVDRFLDHWRPDLVLWTESELWPTMLRRLHQRSIPALLINARMSEKSATRWRWAPGLVRATLRRFDLILAQDSDSRSRMIALGAPEGSTEVSGSLKDSATPLPHDEAARRDLAGRIAGRPVWCAASTHPGEEEIVVEAHRLARKAAPGLMLILVPRHPDRGPGIAVDLKADDWRVGLRSAGDRLDEHQEIYVADTLGELGLWYRLCPVSLVAGSLLPIGGHNPFEPAALGSAIIHGPHVDNFRDAYAQLSSAEAAVEVAGAADLAAAVADLVRPDRAAALATAAWDLSSAGAGTLDIVLERLGPRLDAVAGR